MTTAPQTTEKTAPSPQNKAAKPRDFHAGYKPVLLRGDVKEQLRMFRVRHNVAGESHIERCMVTAALEVVLNDPSLHSRWIKQIQSAASQDITMAFSGN